MKYQSSDTRLATGSGKSLTISSFVTGNQVPTNNPSAGKAVKGGTPDNKGMMIHLCLACSDGVTDLASCAHPMDTCDHWKLLTLKQKEQKVKCNEHPFFYKSYNHTM